MRDATTLAVFLAACILAPGSAGAYTLHRTSNGLPVHWSVPSVTYVVDASLDAISPASLDVVSRSFQAWEPAAGANAPGVLLEKGVADEIGYRIGEENHNTIRYLPAGSELAGNALAITVLTFDDTGAILDSDIIVSGAAGRSFRVLTDDDEGSDDEIYDFDLQDVLTHEAGHSFGLSHNTEDAAVTMYPVINPGEISKRTIKLDDEDGLRALYPPSQAFPMAASCAAGAGGPGSPGGSLPAVAVAVVAAAALRARARRRSARVHDGPR